MANKAIVNNTPFPVPLLIRGERVVVDRFSVLDLGKAGYSVEDVAWDRIPANNRRRLQIVNVPDVEGVTTGKSAKIPATGPSLRGAKVLPKDEDDLEK